MTSYGAPCGQALLILHVQERAPFSRSVLQTFNCRFLDRWQRLWPRPWAGRLSLKALYVGPLKPAWEKVSFHMESLFLEPGLYPEMDL